MCFLRISRHEKSPAFTLIELLVVLGILGILAGIVITAIAPSRQLAAANDAWRKGAQREIANAITQYVIDTGALPAGIPTGSSNAMPICGEGHAGETGCVNLDVLVTDDYITALPVDTVESSGALIGFTIYQQPGGFVSVNPVYLGQSGTNGGTTGGATSGGASGGGVGCVESATYPIVVSGNPGDMAVNDTKLYAVLSLASLEVIDTDTDTVVGSVGIGNDPNDVISYGTKMYVTNQGDGTVTVIDTTSDTATATIGVGNSPFYGQIVNNKLYVANANDDSVSVINTTTDTVVATISVGSYPYKIVGNGTKAYVINQSDDTVSVIDTNTDTVSSTVSVGGQPMNIASLSSYVYVINNTDETVSVINTATDTVSATLSVGSNPNGISVSSGKVYVANYSGNSVSVITGTSVTSTLTGISAPNVMEFDGTYMYVSGSSLYAINDSTESVDTIAAMGSSGIALANGKVYVSFSGGTSVRVAETTGNTACN